MKKLLLAALILVTLSVSGAQAMDFDHRVRHMVEILNQLPDDDQRIEAVQRQIRAEVRAFNQLPEDRRGMALDQSRRDVTPIVREFRNFTEDQQRVFLEFMRNVSRELNNEEREVQAEVFRDIPELVEILRRRGAANANAGDGAVEPVDKKDGVFT